MTRRHIRIDRAPTAWLVRRFVDPDATFAFVEPVQVASLERDSGAIGFDAPADDHETVARAVFRHDALYAALQAAPLTSATAPGRTP